MQVEFATDDFSDWVALRRLLQYAFAYMDSRIDPPSSLHLLSTDGLRDKSTRESLIIATESGELVGCAFADIRENCIYVGKVAVSEHVRGRGVARQLLAAVESLAKNRNIRVLELQTRIELTENHRTFEALGFRTVAQTSHPGYTRATSITMQKDIAFMPDNA